MLEAIEAARVSVRLEIYTCSPGPLAVRFLAALAAAQERGASVRVMVDAVGSIDLPETFWDPLRGAGGEARQFNPLSLNRFGIRDHRKLLVCDEQTAIIGGFNIAQEYDGDGVTSGWCDVGLKLTGAVVAELAAAFDEMFARVDFRHKRFMRLRKFGAKKSMCSGSWRTGSSWTSRMKTGCSVPSHSRVNSVECPAAKKNLSNSRRLTDSSQ